MPLSPEQQAIHSRVNGVLQSLTNLKTEVISNKNFCQAHGAVATVETFQELLDVIEPCITTLATESDAMEDLKNAS